MTFLRTFMILLFSHQAYAGSLEFFPHFLRSASTMLFRSFHSETSSIPIGGHEVLEEYIRNSDFVNEALLGRRLTAFPIEEAPYVQLLDRTLHSLPIASEAPLRRVEYRASNYLHSLQVDDIITYPNYCSTSAHPEFFNFFHHYLPHLTPNVRYIIEHHISGRAIQEFAPLSRLNNAKKLQEILLPRGAKFQILSIEKDETWITITMKELDRDTTPEILDRSTNFIPLPCTFKWRYR